MTDAKNNALHENLIREEAVAGSSDRSFGLVFAAVFLVIGLWPLLRAEGPRGWALVLAAVFLAAALLKPDVLAPLNRLWLKFGLLLHRITNPIVMGVIFFLAVTPTAIVLKMAGKDPLRRKIDKQAPSYWIERTPPGPEPETMKNQF